MSHPPDLHGQKLYLHVFKCPEYFKNRLITFNGISNESDAEKILFEDSFAADSDELADEKAMEKSLMKLLTMVDENSPSEPTFDSCSRLLQ